MTAGRDVTLLVAGVVVGVAMGYFMRNAIAKVLGGASAAPALFANTLSYGMINPLQNLGRAVPGTGIRPAWTNNTVPIFFGR